MAESTSVALVAASVPSSAEISRAEKLVRERFLHEGEDPAVALAPGSPRRRALDQALAELEADPKAKHPSTAWRRQFSLLLGLERLLSDDEPKLADGTVLSAHQVDALSGTLTALLAEAQRAAPNGNGRAPASASPELLASADILGPDDVVQENDAQALVKAADSDGAVGRAEDSEAAEEDGEDESDDDDEVDNEDDDDDALGPVQRAAPDEDEDDLEDEVGLIADEEEEPEEESEPESSFEEEPRDWVEDEDDG
jgi:ribonuclease E